jgi:hypothetical protein
LIDTNKYTPIEQIIAIRRAITAIIQARLLFLNREMPEHMASMFPTMGIKNQKGLRLDPLYASMLCAKLYTAKRNTSAALHITKSTPIVISHNIAILVFVESIAVAIFTFFLKLLFLSLSYKE